jgi:HlyD family secretion protein
MDRPIGTPRWRATPWTRSGMGVGAIALALFVLFHFLASPERTVRMKRTSVTVATVERAVFHDFVPLRAKVVALNSVYLDALEGGRVEKILAQAGDRVSENQPLVILTNTELELDVLEREGRLIESITQLQSYETQLEQNRIANQKALADIEYQVTRLRRSLARRKALVSRALEPVETQESVQDELDHYLQVQPLQADSNRKQEELRVRQLPQVQGQLEKLHEDLLITHGKLDNLVVRAPITGQLTSLDLEVGENRNRGDRFAQITPETGRKLEASVDEYYLGRVRKGQAAEMETPDMDSTTKSWRLVVARVYPEVKDGTFTVDLTFSGSSRSMSGPAQESGIAADAPEGLLPGQSLQGKLEVGADRPATVLPSGAFLDKTGGKWVFLLDKDGRSAHRRDVDLGRRTADQVEVLTNLSPGDHVVVSDYTGLERTERIDFEQ